MKYKTDAAVYYRKKLIFAARGLPFEEKAPPRNAQEMAERTADSIKDNANKGAAATKEGLANFNEKYKIGETSSVYADKLKTGISGFFSKKPAATPAEPAE